MSPKRIYSGDPIDRVKLPQPDPKNITVLTRNLPNIPILPWNHYDSPWLQRESNGNKLNGDSQPDQKNQSKRD